jgi:hypothetical protein
VGRFTRLQPLKDVALTSGEERDRWLITSCGRCHPRADPPTAATLALVKWLRKASSRRVDAARVVVEKRKQFPGGTSDPYYGL